MCLWSFMLGLKTLIRGCASWNPNQWCLVLGCPCDLTFDHGIDWNSSSLGRGSWPYCHTSCHASSIIKLALCMRFIHLTYMSTCLGFSFVSRFLSLHPFIWCFQDLNLGSLHPFMWYYQNYQSLVIDSWILGFISPWSLVMHGFPFDLWSIHVHSIMVCIHFNWPFKLVKGFSPCAWSIG